MFSDRPLKVEGVWSSKKTGLDDANSCKIGLFAATRIVMTIQGSLIQTLVRRQKVNVS
jgi:hypothetical protein